MRSPIFFFRLLLKYKSLLFLSKIEKKFILHNEKKWKLNKKRMQSKNIILVDLFYWNPWIYIWSYLTNILSYRLNAKIKYFYFDLYQSKYSMINRFYILKLTKIFKSFNVTKGISELDFYYSKKETKLYNKEFKKINSNTQELVNYKRKNIIIGHLIYDTYLRQKLVATIDLRDKELKVIFIRALKYFDEIYKYLSQNKVKVIIPSHLCYINYGIISSIAAQKKINIIKINSNDRGTALFRLHKIDKNKLLDEPPYYNYAKIFNNFSILQKKNSRIIGKDIITKRISGENDNTLPYMKTNQFSKKLKLSIKTKAKQGKEKIFIFPHCYLDNPHRYRYMIFQDFYKQVKFFLDLSLKLDQYEWYYKPHPNELRGTMNIHYELLKNYPNVKSLDTRISHKSILSENPKCIITNHGTIAHEYAYFNIPVINTGDNPHINYNFCLHMRNKTQLVNTFLNLNKDLKKINFNKNKIYEFMYMHYYHFNHMYEKDSLMPDSYIVDNSSKHYNNPKIKYDFLNSDKTLGKYLNETKKIDQNMKKYINLFLDKNI